uniref:Uncharacterized protein n=1 Tax=Lepeophtheirus salmonis TaxID=72036 RepID=A0A0K2SY30_LEPSM
MLDQQQKGNTCGISSAPVSVPRRLNRSLASLSRLPTTSRSPL